jgi:VIT1/CCC1 family predicted Fe2+/Mn2+ transporter
MGLGVGALFAVGALLSRYTARTWWWSGLRQLLIGAAAAGVTAAIGALLGATAG